MLSLARPGASASFAVKSSMHLDALRVVAEAGTTITGKHFENRDLWKKHKETLVGNSGLFTKCAWCERYYDWRYELNVEHYRPKAEVTCWEGSPPLISDLPPREVWVSEGYWWLAFDWNNYSLACDLCNQRWKRNLFPVQGARAAYGQGMETQEVTLLLDPMSAFRTADHFSWDEFGYIDARSERGAATIITCGLNRKQLVGWRRKTARNILIEIKRLSRARDMEHTARQHIRALRELCAPESEFAGMNRWWVEQLTGWTWEILRTIST